MTDETKVSDTPRTDAILPLGAGNDFSVPHYALELAGLCRHFERELNALRLAETSDDKKKGFFVAGGKEYCNEEFCLSEMLREGVLFCNTGKFGDDDTVVLFVNCNDLFAWGCADAEPFKSSEIGDLYRFYKSGNFGVDKWCCIHRGQKPQEPIIDLMKEADVWDETMEALPDNTQDAEVRALFYELAMKKQAALSAMRQEDE